MPWDAPASISNAILHTAQNYGVAPNEPSMSMAAPWIKASWNDAVNRSVDEPRRDSGADRRDRRGHLTPSVERHFGEAKGEAGSYAGGKIADVTDPRLREGLETGGAVAAQGVPGISRNWDYVSVRQQ